VDESPHIARHWLPDSFFRKPEWRWLRAGVLAPTRRRLDSRIDDGWVAYARIIRRVRSRWPGTSKEKLSAIRAAQELWSGADSQRRSVLEAYLLTPLPIQEVGETCGLGADVVEAYHAVFFDVRSRSSATDWLLCQAVGWVPSITRGTPDMDQIWRYLAVAGGEHVLEVAIAVMTGASLPKWLMESFVNPAVDDARVRLRVQLAIFAMTATTPQQWKAVTAIRKRLRRLEAVHVDRTPDDHRLAAMEAFLATGDDRHVDASPAKVNAGVQRVQVLDADVTDVPVNVPNPIPVSWRMYDAEDPDADGRVDVDAGRSRIFVFAD
jgi:hypothetical protein